MDVRCAKEQDLLLLNKYLPVNIPNFHEEKIRDQETGDSAWLIAWENNVPMGHLQIRFTGGTEEYINKYAQGIPYIEATGVSDAYRRQGVASHLVNKAEEMARSRGYKSVGLAVGEDDNPGAKALYERLGYKSWDHGTFWVEWNITREDGKEVKEREECIYLQKELT